MRKRIIAAAAILVAVAAALTGCGAAVNQDAAAAEESYFYGINDWSGKSSTAGYDMQEGYAAESPAEPEPGTSVAADRKLIQTAWLELESREYAKALAALEQMVADCGGYIESRSEQGSSLYNSRYNARYAELTARIPADRLEEALTAAGELCNVVSRSTDVADVTESYTDTEARLETLRLQEQRLLEILSKADKLSDVLELESRLSEVRYQIESYEASLRSMDSRISYSTLHITLQEVVEYSIVNDPPQTLGQRLSDGFAASMKMVKNGAENLLVWLVTFLPVILLWAAVLAAVIWLAVRLLRRLKQNGKLPRRKKGQKKQEKENKPVSQEEPKP